MATSGKRTTKLDFGTTSGSKRLRIKDLVDSDSSAPSREPELVGTKIVNWRFNFAPSRSRSDNPSALTQPQQSQATPEASAVWRKYQPLLRITQGGEAVLACPSGITDTLCVVRKLAITNVHQRDETRRLLKAASSTDSIVQVLDFLDHEASIYVIAPYHTLSLIHIIAAPAKLTEGQFAYLSAQVLSVATCLNNLKISCKISLDQFFLTADKRVQLAFPEIVSDQDYSAADLVTSFALVIHQLLGLTRVAAGSLRKDLPPNAIELSPLALDFIEQVTKASVLISRKHRFLSAPPSASCLTNLICLAEICAHKDWELIIERQIKGNVSGPYRMKIDEIGIVQPLSPARQMNVQRLIKLFRLQGCRRLLQEHYVYVGSPNAVDMLRRVRPRAPTSESIPRLSAGEEDDIVLCLEGISRIVAAKAVLQGADRWWIVYLVSTRDQEDQALMLQHFKYRYMNEGLRADGDILKEYIRHQHDGAVLPLVLGLLSPHKRRNLVRLASRHQTLLDALAVLANYFPEMFSATDSVHLGVLHKMFSLQIDHMLINYLSQIRLMWSAVRHASRLRARFWNSATGLCHAFSTEDRISMNTLLSEENLIDTAELAEQARQENPIDLETFSDRRRRELAGDLANISAPLPTIRGFFEDYKYLALGCQVLWGLFPQLDEKPLDRAVSQRWHSTGRARTIRSVGTYTQHDAEATFTWAYRELWLAALRFWPLVLTQRPRKARTRDRSSNETYKHADRPKYWSILNLQAQVLGFETGHALDAADVPLEGGLLPGMLELTSEEVNWYRCGIPYLHECWDDFHSLYAHNLVIRDDQLLHISRYATRLVFRKALVERVFGAMEIPDLSSSDLRIPQLEFRDVVIGNSEEETDAGESSPLVTLDETISDGGIAGQHDTQLDRALANIEQHLTVKLYSDNLVMLNVLFPSWNEWFEYVQRENLRDLLVYFNGVTGQLDQGAVIGRHTIVHVTHSSQYNFVKDAIQRNQVWQHETGTANQLHHARPEQDTLPDDLSDL